MTSISHDRAYALCNAYSLSPLECPRFNVQEQAKRQEIARLSRASYKFGSVTLNST